jgi:hypothetical protein
MKNLMGMKQSDWLWTFAIYFGQEGFFFTSKFCAEEKTFEIFTRGSDKRSVLLDLLCATFLAWHFVHFYSQFYTILWDTLHFWGCVYTDFLLYIVFGFKEDKSKRREQGK